MDQEPEFYVSPEDLEAQMTAEERGEGTGTHVSMNIIIDSQNYIPKGNVFPT